MGKYPNSDIHAKYSDWHWQLVNIDEKYKRLYVADIDRLWLEYDFRLKEVVAVIDIKWEGSEDGLTPTEKGIYEWFLCKGVFYYVVYIDRDFTTFRVVNHRKDEIVMTSIEYAEWLLSLRSKRYNYNRHNHTSKTRILHKPNNTHKELFNQS